MNELSKISNGWKMADQVKQFEKDQLSMGHIWAMELRTKIAKQRIKRMFSDKVINQLRKELAKFK